MIVVVMMLLPCSIQGYIDVCCRVWTLLSCANLACPVLQGRCLVRLHIAQGMADVAFPPPQQATAVTADALSYVFCVCVCRSAALAASHPSRACSKTGQTCGMLQQQGPWQASLPAQHCWLSASASLTKAACHR